jgi:hypothetical protein
VTAGERDCRAAARPVAFDRQFDDHAGQDSRSVARSTL